MKVPGNNTEILRPTPLRAGDTVGIVAPASPIEAGLLEAGCARLRRMGYNPVYSSGILERDLYFAGSVARRARELEEMFTRPDVAAIICARGGYGCNYLLPEVNLEVLRKSPKVFVGYSDVTTLLTYLVDTGMVAFHGPMLTKDFVSEDGVDEGSWRAAVEGVPGWELSSEKLPQLRGLSDGQAEGLLYGGCLSMLAASLGTPYEIHTSGTLLFIEDVAAKPFQIDRMLMQLKLAGKFQGVRGIVFGEMLDCRQYPEQPFTLEEVVARVVGDLGIPVAFGLPSGHVKSRNITLPLGVRASLTVNGGAVALKILQAPVEQSAATQPHSRNS